MKTYHIYEVWTRCVQVSAASIDEALDEHMLEQPDGDTSLCLANWHVALTEEEQKLEFECPPSSPRDYIIYELWTRVATVEAETEENAIIQHLPKPVYGLSLSNYHIVRVQDAPEAATT